MSAIQGKHAPVSHLYAKTDVGDVEVNGDNRTEHDETADGVLHEADAAAPTCVRALAPGPQQRNACVEPDGNGDLKEKRASIITGSEGRRRRWGTRAFLRDLQRMAHRNSLFQKGCSNK